MRRNFFVMGLLTFFSVLFCVKTSAFEVSSGKTCGTARCGERVTFSFSGVKPICFFSINLFFIEG